MGKVLLPIHDIEDGTTIEYGFYVARKCNMKLEMLHVEADQKLEAAEQAALDETRARALRDGIDATLTIVKGQPAKEIVRKAKNLELVILKHKHEVDTLGSGLLRDISEQLHLSPLVKDVIKQVTVPSLITFGLSSMMKKPLIAYNGSRKSRRILRAGLELMGKKIFRRGILLYVGKKTQQARALLRDARALGREFGVDMEIRLEDGDPAATILETAERTSCDLIIMGAYIRNVLQQRISASVTESVLARSLHPVLVG